MAKLGVLLGILVLVYITVVVVSQESSNTMPYQEWHVKSPHNVNGTMTQWHRSNTLPLLKTDGNKNLKRVRRIIGGQEGTPHSYPHKVALYNYYTDNYVCGGSLINDRWVLTAAHCLITGPDQKDIKKTMKVVMGAHNINKYEHTQVTMYSSQYFIHEDFNTTYYLSDDIALIYLPNPVQFNEYIQAATLGNSLLEHGTNVTVTGWGMVNGITSSDVLREATVPVISTTFCTYYWPYVTSNQICTGYIKGVTPCYGDSGSPLHYNGSFYGITSFGHGNKCWCLPSYASVFTSVPAYLDWIYCKIQEIPPKN